MRYKVNAGEVANLLFRKRVVLSIVFAVAVVSAATFAVARPIHHHSSVARDKALQNKVHRDHYVRNKEHAASSVPSQDASTQSTEEGSTDASIQAQPAVSIAASPPTLVQSASSQTTPAQSLTTTPSVTTQAAKTPTVASGSTQSASTLYFASFDNLPVGSISQSNLKIALGDRTMSTSANMVARTSIVPTPERGNVMRQFFAANSYGVAQGIDATAKMSRTVDVASIQYDIRFSEKFEWSKGGKLPGLSGTEPGYHPGLMSGCEDNTAHGWSGRGMWISPLSYPKYSNPNNEWIGYMYNPGKQSNCGDNVQSDKSFIAGKWHTVKQYYKMNTPGVANGIHQLWFDGELVYSKNNFVYRKNSDVHINYLMWSMFRGGHTYDWASSRDGTIDIDNLRVETY